MKRPKKRYNTRQQILAQIDAEQERLTVSLATAEAHDAEMSVLKAWFAKNQNHNLTDAQSQVWHGKFRRIGFLNEQLGLFRRRSVPRHNLNLLRLKALLAEFDTEPMPFLDNPGRGGEMTDIPPNDKVSDPATQC